VVPTRIRCGAAAGSITLMPVGNAPSARAADEAITASANAALRIAWM